MQKLERKALALTRRQGFKSTSSVFVSGDNTKKRVRKKGRAKRLDVWGKRPSYLGVAKGADLPVALLLPGGRVVGFPAPVRRPTGKAAGPNGSLLIVNDTMASGRFVERFGRGALGYLLARVDHAIIATPRPIRRRADVVAEARHSEADAIEEAYDAGATEDDALEAGEAARLSILQDAACDMREKAWSIRDLYRGCWNDAVRHGRHSTLVETSGASRADQWRRYFERRGVEVELRPESLP